MKIATKPTEKKNCCHNKMKKTVGCFTDEKLRELACQPNVTVMQPTHDNVYKPWPAKRVSECVRRVSTLTRSGASAADIKKDAELSEFAAKYITFFEKLTDPQFVADVDHIKTVQRLILLRQMVEEGLLTDVAAQAQSADIALKSLATRVQK